MNPAGVPDPPPPEPELLQSLGPEMRNSFFAWPEGCKYDIILTLFCKRYHETCATFPTRFAREKDAFLPSRRPVGVAATDEGPVGTIGALLALRTTRLPVLGLRRRINDNVL